ncbi:MAG: NAD(P)H-hydrate dehydratase, partial [Candidatus Sumerlaeota bacterium]
LTGLIGGFLAQGCTELDAACLGVFIHGLAGDTVASEFGKRGMTARDVLQSVPLVMNAIDLEA